MAGQFPDPLAVDSFLRSYWVIVPDPTDAEFIRTPELQLIGLAESGRLVGDCDDAATLAGSLLAVTGWPASFVAYRKNGDPEFSHVNLHSYGIQIDPVVPELFLPLQNFAETIEVPI